jgi:hypothetical protein
MGNRQQIGQETAEILALRALAWLAGQEDLVNGFLGATGLSASDLTDAATRPEMLAAVLDLLGDETRLLAFCTDEGLRPEEPMASRVFLPGGDVPHWT